ncbi:MAG TPA: hypothetical protein VK426_08050 [Methanobacterium sp.]|nr:hypothetical protein [Methanobacterium sp.]
MNLTKEEVEALQEQLVLVYKVIHQNRMANSFYFQGLETQKSPSKLINKLNKLENPEETLKACIFELEEIKENKSLNKGIFNEIMETFDISYLNKKYGIEKTQDLDKLNVMELLGLL